MTQSGFVSLIILSKSAARYFFGGLTPVAARLGFTKLSAVSRRPWLVSHTATSSLPAAKVLVMAVRYMREREPTPTFTYLRRPAAAWTIPDKPAAAAPAPMSTVRRSNVSSLISYSPVWIMVPGEESGESRAAHGSAFPTFLTRHPPAQRYIKFDHRRSTSRTALALSHTPPRCTPSCVVA